MPPTPDVTPFELPGVRVLDTKRFGDDRGYFCETYHAQDLAKAGINCVFVQDNESFSAAAGTLRGLHYQAPPFAQAKLVRVIRGAVLDVVVDARKDSPSFGRWMSVELNAENGRQLFVPRGFLHGFVTLLPETLVTYKVDNHYSREHDGAVAWNDPDLGVDWGLAGRTPVLSDKDAKAPSWRDWTSPF